MIVKVGDCFAYALAIERDEPLLSKGAGFKHTDVRSALSSSSASCNAAGKPQG
jgi:uncharacterized protein with PIN domain